MRNLIIIERYSKDGPTLSQDKVLAEEETENGKLIYTTSFGTILLGNDGKTEFGPNCTDGMFVYKRHQ